MGNKSKEFFWDYSEEPHASRRLKILKKHPEIRQLMTTEADRRQVCIAIFLGLFQLFLGIFVCYYRSHIPLFIRYLITFFVGSPIASWLFLSMHEAAHGLVFGPTHPWKNRFFGIFINIVLGVPVFLFFKFYHKDHHKYLGMDKVDIEMPTKLEVKLFDWHPCPRLLWLQLSSLFQTFRPRPSKPYTLDVIINICLVCAFDLLFFYFGYGYALGHNSCALLMASGVSFIGTWGLAHHGVFFKGEDNRSYYGWMNPLFLNFGHHMEHHDFPNIPARYLPEVRRLAPEFYEDQHTLDSLWSTVIQFLFGGEYSGLHARLKRPGKLNITLYYDAKKIS